MTTSAVPSYAGYRFPAEVISHAVWLYVRFPLSLRMVDELLTICGIVVSHETVRQWALKFGQCFAAQIVVRHGLRAAGVLGKGGCGDVELACHPGHEGDGWLVEVGEYGARVAQQRELHSAAYGVDVAAALGHEVLVGPGQGEQPRSGVTVSALNGNTDATITPFAVWPSF